MKKYLLLLSTMCFIAITLCKAQIPTAGLIASYPFTGNAGDSSGNGNNGTVNGATLTTDRFGNNNSAYLFNGVSSYISVPDVASLRLNNTDFTISVWVLETARNANDEDAIITKRQPGSQNGYNYGINGTEAGADGPAGTVVWVVSGGSDPQSNTISTVPLNQWTNIVLKYVLATQTLSTYFNGAFNISASSIPTPSATETSPMLIGYDSNGDPYYFNGKIDDINIYNRALSDSEIVKLYNPDSVLTTCPTITVIATQAGTTTSAYVSASGGAIPYTYSWSTSPVQTSDTATGLANGASYTVTVTDKNGCTGATTVSILTGIASTGDITALNIYPNPSNGIFVASIHLADVSDVYLSIADMMGRKIYESTDNAIKDLDKPFNLGTEAAGVYIVNVKTAGATANMRIVIR